MQNVERTLGASEYDQFVGPVGVVSASNGWGQWVWTLGVVSGWWIFLPHNEVSLLFWSQYFFGSIILSVHLLELFCF